MQPKNQPHLTATERTAISEPAVFLRDNELLKGRILDFGCGFGFDVDELSRKGFNIVGYDNHFRPAVPDGKFDTIMCNFVLDVLEPHAQAQVMMIVSSLLKSGGTAYFAVRRNIENEGFTYDAEHDAHTYQCTVQLPFDSIEANDTFELYSYRHFNQQPRKEGESCPFCRLSKSVEIICETATCVAFYDGYPASAGHALIIPKRHVESYFDLTHHEREAMNLMLCFVRKKIDYQYRPAGYTVGINVGRAAGQTVRHVAMHLIPRYTGDICRPEGGVRNILRQLHY